MYAAATDRFRAQAKSGGVAMPATRAAPLRAARTGGVIRSGSTHKARLYIRIPPAMCLRTQAGMHPKSYEEKAKQQ
jgi:hypothetical protein